MRLGTGTSGAARHPGGTMSSVFVAYKIEREATQDAYLTTQQTCANNYFAFFFFCSTPFRRHMLIRYPYSQRDNSLLERVGREKVGHYDAA